MSFEGRLNAAGTAGLSEFESGPAMVAIPGGRFVMGSPGAVLTERSWWETELPKLHEPNGVPTFFTPKEWEEVRHESPYNERPQREVSVRPFALGKYIVTCEEWDACVADGFCLPAPAVSEGGGETAADRVRRAVVNVSWNDVTGDDGRAKGFLRWLNWRAAGDENAALYRLPTEAEWEYAARAGSSTRYHFGDDESAFDDYGWHVLSEGAGERRVGEKRANSWGLHDMYGLAGEWVQDCWHYNYVNAPQDGSAPWMDADGGLCSEAVVRGAPAFRGGMGSAVRACLPRDRRSRTTGFRIARDLAQGSDE